MNSKKFPEDTSEILKRVDEDIRKLGDMFNEQDNIIKNMRLNSKRLGEWSFGEQLIMECEFDKGEYSHTLIHPKCKMGCLAINLKRGDVILRENPYCVVVSMCLDLQNDVIELVTRKLGSKIPCECYMEVIRFNEEICIIKRDV
jgi:hypothetical protein